MIQNRKMFAVTSYSMELNYNCLSAAEILEVLRVPPSLSTYAEESLSEKEQIFSHENIP